MTSNLTDSPASIVVELLVNGGQATEITNDPLLAWPAVVSVEPDSPDDVITVDDTTGQSDGRDMAGGVLNQHYGLQLRFRSVGAVSGWTKAQDVRAWLSEHVSMVAVSVGSNNYIVHCLAKFGQVLKLGTDAPSSKRWLHTLNCFVSIRQL